MPIDPNQRGKFRIGFVTLQIPPIDIITNRVVNDDQVATLRTGTPMFVKSGQARWDVTVRWKAIREAKSNGTMDYSQWEDLRSVIAMFKSAPFVQIENAYLRQIFTSDVHPAYSIARMAFALKQIKIDTNPDTTNVIDVTLTMTLFNYYPYSLEFAYKNQAGDSTESFNSPEFQSYITRWKRANLDGLGTKPDDPMLPSWQVQEDEITRFIWRKYIYLPLAGGPTPIPSATANKAPATPKVAPQSVVPKKDPTVKKPSQANSVRKLKGRIPDNDTLLVQKWAAFYKLDVDIVTALILYESSGNARAGEVTHATNGGGLGYMQLVRSTAKSLGVTDPFDPDQNIRGGCQLLSNLLKKYKNYPQALAAYNTGEVYVDAYANGVTKYIKDRKGNVRTVVNPDGIRTADGLPPAGIPKTTANPAGENAPLYVATILGNAGKPDLVNSIPESPKEAVLQKPQVSIDTPNPEIIGQISGLTKALPPGQWAVDHYTEFGANFFQEQTITLSGADSTIESPYNLFPFQFSITMVNNLPLIPLSASQYPTYQHVGPCDTMIAIGMTSVGEENSTINESTHDGIRAITNMSQVLENQFHELRTTYRKVSSVHRMQAIYIQHKILNMLGIKGVMLRGITTETVPSSSNMMQVSLLASQYENIFEETSPLRINGIAQAYKPVLKNILQSDRLDKLSPDEKNALSEVKAFADAWASHDPKYLMTKILSISVENNYLSATETLDTNITGSDKTKLLNVMDQKVSATGLSDTLNILKGAKNSDKWKGLQSRRLDIQTSQRSMTYADVFVFSQIPGYEQPALLSQLDQKFSSEKNDTLDSMYQKLYDYLIVNPLFSRQAALLVDSPAYGAEFAKATPDLAPSQQQGNEGHECYKDLGLGDINTEPDLYFVDDAADFQSKVSSQIDATIGTVQSTFKEVNDPQTIKGATGPNGFGFYSAQERLFGDSSALNRMVKAPGQSMNQAFPTYKLLLIEENNSGPFFAFDNFYSYSSVIDIEVIKYRDRPDTAVLQITNLAHILNHKLYDHSAAGKLEAREDRFNIDGGTDTADGQAIQGGNPNTILEATRSLSGVPYQITRQNMTEGPGDSYLRIPLKYFSLQTGSKIQIRMGYSNDPDKLFPVFTGTVTDIEGDEILTLTCQSFQLDLMTNPGSVVIANSRFGFNFATGGAAFGGLSISNSGDTGSVVRKMLTSPAAKRFGHWQVGSIPDPLIKGFSWTELAAQTLLDNSKNADLQTLKSLLLTGWDRSYENIAINQLVTYDGKPTSDKVRQLYMDQNPDPILFTASYSIPKQSKLSVWEIIKDVSRRYPEYNLMVKSYGFPYGADATLVLAHPLDWYYYRYPLAGDRESEATSNQLHAKNYQTWWATTGSNLWNKVWNDMINKFQSSRISVFGAPIKSKLNAARDQLTTKAASGPEELFQATQAVQAILNGRIHPGNQFYDIYNDFVTNIFQNLTQGFRDELAIEFNQIYKQWQIQLSQLDPASKTGRIRPCRSYHYVDNTRIVHNGITINDKIFNAVRLGESGTVHVFNQNIQKHNWRIIDVNDMVAEPGHGYGVKFVSAWHFPYISPRLPEGNITSDSMERAYAQSFLKDEVSQMYRGEIVIRGTPEIEPFDIIILNDVSTGMVGPVEVDSVIHSFNAENGFITIIKPRLMLLVNESVSIDIIRAVALALSNASTEVNRLASILTPGNANSTVAGDALGIGLEATALTAATISLGVWVPPLGLVLAGAVLLAGWGILAYTGNEQEKNFFKMMPLSRFGRPWIGGLQGFAISDFSRSALTALQWFDADEIWPTLESWYDANNFVNQYSSQSI